MATQDDSEPDPRDDDATPVPPPEDPPPTSVPEDEVEREPPRPAPSIVFPGFKEVRIVAGERREAASEDDPTPVAPAPTLGDGSGDGTPLGSEETAIITPGQPGDDAPALSGREATLVGGGDPPTDPLSGREATVVGGQGPTPTPLTGREATMVGAGGGPTPTPLTGREATMVGDNDATRATMVGDPGATVVGDDEGTAATMVPGRTLADAGGDRTPPTYGGRPQTRAGSSAAFDANWHLSGRKGPFTGHTWGDFALGGILGEGGMGAVYRAMQTSLKRRVAIKVLPTNMAQDASLLHRFQLEASTSSKLSSPHIVQVYFIGENEGHHYYAMEFVDGTDLYEIHKQRKESDNPIAPEEAADYILQAARGLAEAGRYGVVHRDIKPPNLMVDKSGLLKIADFGIVKVLGEHNLTMTGQAVGTPAYCSPEQGRGDGDIDQRSDLYSLGVVFYELACGKKPFEATTPNALIYKHCFDEPELPKLLNASISNEIQAVILRLLQKKPENRYQSAEELVRDLEALKTGAMLESALANIRGTGASEAKREQMGWLQRHLVPVLVAAGLGVAAIGGGGYWWLQQRQTEELQARRATEDLRPTITAALEGAQSLPSDIDELLDEYARLSPDGESDSDLKRWRAKVTKARTLQQALAPLDDGADGAEIRRRAQKDLAAYTELVGTGDGAAQRWAQRLSELDSEEREVRDEIRSLTAGLLDQGRRDSLAGRVARLATLAGGEDELVAAARIRIGDFDRQISALAEELAVIDAGAAITEAQRGRLLTALGQFAPLVGSGDARLERWRVALDEAAGQVDRLRAQLAGALGTSSTLPLTTIEATAGDLELYAELVSEDDRNLAAWRKQVEVSRKRVAELRARLEQLEQQQDAEGILPAPVLPGLATTLDQLQAQAGQGDQQLLAWRQVARRSESMLGDLSERLRRLSANQPEPITLARQEQLSTELARLEELDGIEPAQARRYRERLAAEDERVATLRANLAALDRAVPYTAALERDLLQLQRDLGEGDGDLERWLAKRARILALREQLAVLDERRSVPDDLQQQYDALVALVGPDAPEVTRWRGKVALIAELRADLAGLLEPKPLPPEVDAKLALWAEQVGADDATAVRLRAKVARVRELGAALTLLEETLRCPPELVSRSRDQLAELVSLVGPEDLVTQRAARRLDQLEGPPPPAWAAEIGRDEFGLWALLGPDDLDLRLRWCPPGRFVLGEDGREADEVAVPVTISRGFWIADSELTQRQWSALIARNPSYFKGAQRPVERVSIADTERWLAALDQTFATPGARLPSEAEWEFAARGGESAPPRDELEALAWYDRNSGDATQAVRGRYANPIGLFDCLGNVAEWTRDGYGGYPTAATTDPLREGGNRRVARGGSWGDPAAAVRLANRIAVDPGVRSMYLGFRPVIPAEWDTPPDGNALLVELARDIGEATWTLDLGEARISVSIPRKRREQAAPTGDAGDPSSPADDEEDLP